MDNYTGFHGTNSQAIDSIRITGFKISTSRIEWLGDGVYFFINGASCPINNAREWAKNNAWDNINKRHKYKEYSILKVLVNGERILDLRVDSDLRIFEKLRSHILERYLTDVNKFHKKPSPDTFLCNAVSKSLKLDILINNFYIKTKVQRVRKLQSRIPNTTVLCAKSTAIINIKSIEEIERKEINDE